MSAIMAAAQRLEDRRIDAVLGRAFTRGDELRAMIIAAGRAIVRASNAAGAGRVVEGAPRTRRVQWAGPGTTGEWTAWTTNGATTKRPALRRTVDGVRQPNIAPAWDGRRWLWGTWSHDPRPCAWPRPFAVRQG